MAKRYTAQARRSINLALRIAKQFHQDSIGSEYLLAGLLKEGDGVAAQVLMGIPIKLDQILSMMEELSLSKGRVIVTDASQFTPEGQKILTGAEGLAVRLNSDSVGTEHLLLAILENRGCSANRILLALGVDLGKVYMDILSAIGSDYISKEEKKNITSGKPLDLQKTPTLDTYAIDLTQKARDGELDPLIARDNEVMRMIQILSRRGKNNPCLIGEPGVGKTAIVEGLAEKIADGMVPDHLSDKRILTLDLSSMVAGSKYRGEFEERIKSALKEVQTSGNIILFLDEIHTIIGAGGAEGAIDASSIMKPALSRGLIQLIGATTIDEYRKHIEKDAALERRFQPITVEEPTVEQTIEILRGLRSKYEAHHELEITDDGIEAAARLAARYINDRFLPDKAIDLMDEAASKVRLSGFKAPLRGRELQQELELLNRKQEDAIVAGDLKLASTLRKEKQSLQEELEKTKQQSNRRQHKRMTVGKNEIADAVSQWTKIPVKQLTESESGKLRNLEKTLHKRVISQEEAITAVSKAVRRGRVGLKNPNRPIGSFLFLGPTGVGKTEISKALSEAVFGSEDSMIRVDMSEYMEKHSVSKMIGSPPGYVGYDERADS